MNLSNKSLFSRTEPDWPTDKEVDEVLEGLTIIDEVADKVIDSGILEEVNK